MNYACDSCGDAFSKGRLAPVPSLEVREKGEAQFRLALWCPGCQARLGPLKKVPDKKRPTVLVLPPSRDELDALLQKPRKARR